MRGLSSSLSLQSHEHVQLEGDNRLIRMIFAWTRCRQFYYHTDRLLKGKATLHEQTSSSARGDYTLITLIRKKHKRTRD